MIYVCANNKQKIAQPLDIWENISLLSSITKDGYKEECTFQKVP